MAAGGGTVAELATNSSTLTLYWDPKIGKTVFENLRNDKSSSLHVEAFNKS